MVRKYKDEDLEKVKKIALDDAKDIVFNIESIIKYNTDRFYVWQAGDDIAGFSFFQPFGFGNRIDICAVTAKSFRRRGFGSALFDEAFKAAKRDYNPQWFECKIVSDDLPAIHFCGAKGFAPWISIHTMIYNDELLPTPSTLFEPYEDKYYESYYELLGDAFYDMRKSIGAEPYRLMPNGNRDEMFESETFLAINSQDKPIAAVTIEMGNHIDNLAVLPEAQNLGFGRQLAMFATNRCLMSPQGYAELDVLSTNEKAIGLYKSLGYKIHRTVAVLRMKA